MNQYLRNGLSLIFVISLASHIGSAASPETTPGRWLPKQPPSIKTITLGTSLGVVIKQLGKPLKKTHEEGDAAGMEDTLTLEYRGLTVKLNVLEKTKGYRVWGIHVKGKEWTVSPGLKIGMKQSDVVALLGEPEDREVEGSQYLIYNFPEADSGVAIKLTNGFASEIEFSEDYS